MYDLLFGTVFTVAVSQSDNTVWAGGGETCAFVPMIFKSTDKGETWEEMLPPFPGPSNSCYSIALHPTSPDIVYAGLARTVVKTTDGGATWEMTGLQDVPVNFTALVVDRNNPRHVWAGGTRLAPTDSLLWETFDGGTSWQNIKILPGMKGISALVQDPSVKNVINVGTLGMGVWRYKSVWPSLADYFPMQVGNKWSFAVSEIFSPSSDSLTEAITDTLRTETGLYFVFNKFRHYRNIALQMTDDNKILMHNATEQEQVWLDFSAAVGDSWRVTAPDGSAEWTVFLQSKTDTITVPAGTFTDCYRFGFNSEWLDNNWEEWYARGVGPVQRVIYGAIVYKYELFQAQVNGKEYPTLVMRRPESIAKGFLLYPNFPNPFNENTVIRYNLSRPGFVTLEIYNIRGQKVRSLVSKQSTAGTFTTYWDGKDDSGRVLNSGVYFIRLQAGKFSRRGRVVFLK